MVFNPFLPVWFLYEWFLAMMSDKSDKSVFFPDFYPDYNEKDPLSLHFPSFVPERLCR